MVKLLILILKFVYLTQFQGKFPAGIFLDIDQPILKFLWVDKGIGRKKTVLKRTALAGVAQWIEHGPANQRVAGSIPSQGTGLGCGPGPW